MTSPPPSRRFLWPALVCALAGAAVFQFFGNATHGYIDTNSLFWWWGYQWFNAASETEHGVLILALSAWLFWRNLGRNLEACPSRRTAGDEGVAAPVTAMLVGLGLHALGFAAQQTRVSIIALLVFAWGVLRLAGGRRWSAAAAFPLAFMVFAIPLNALDSVGLWLRMWVIGASAGLAHAAGIGVLRNGTQLLAPDGRYNYDVAYACSGVRSLMALTALSLLAGYLNFRSAWRRGATLLLCFPLVYLGNVARITSIIFAAQWGGQVWGDRAHDVMGYGVFAIVLGGVLAAVNLMERWSPEPEPLVMPKPDCHLLNDNVPLAKIGNEKPSCHLIDDKRRWRVAAMVAGLAGAEMVFLARLAALPPRGDTGVRLTADGKTPVALPAFPSTDWIGRSTAVTAVEREILPPDTGFSRMVYFNLNDLSKPVLLSIVLSGRDRTSIHRPELCLMGQGWTIRRATEQRFDFPGRPEATFPATLLRVQREAQTPKGRIVVPQLVAYWFVSGETVVASHWQRLAFDAWNRVAHARADRWAYVLMQTDATDGEAAAVARMQAVLRETLPAFQRPLPAQ